MLRSRTLRLSAIIVSWAATCATGYAFSPAPFCPDDQIEGNMIVRESTWLWSNGKSIVSGIVVEDYEYKWSLARPEKKSEFPPPTPEMSKFQGVRVVDCAKGKMIAIDTLDSEEEVSAALTATEFLRNDLQAGRWPAWSKIQKAAQAVYGGYIPMTTDEETCGCAERFPEVRPASLKPYSSKP